MNLLGYAPYLNQAVGQIINRNRQAKQDALTAMMAQTNMRHVNAESDALENPDEAVTYLRDDQGNYIAVPKKVRAGGPSLPSLPGPSLTPSASGASSTPTGPGPSAPTLPAAAPTDTVPPVTGVPPRAPTGAPTITPIPTGIKAPPKAVPRIDPLSSQGIAADSSKAEIIAGIKNRNTLPKPGAADPLVVTVDPATGTRTYTQRSKAAGMQAPAPNAGGLSGGMGTGGLGGLARTASGITEMNQADQMMRPFEETAKTGQAKYDGLDYFKGLMTKMYDAHGKIDQGIHSAAFAQLDRVNPDLANYLRAGEAWALADGTISGRTSDFRTKLDAFVSSIGPNAGAQHIANTQQMRATRLNELQKFQPAMEAAASRFLPGGGKGTPSGSTTNAGSAGNINLGAPSQLSPLRQKYDAAAQHLKAQGKTPAQIIQVIGQPPEGE